MLLITDLPDIMDDEEQWHVAAACLRRWFRGGAHAMAASVKEGRVSLTTLGSAELEEQILTMDWALDFSRIKQAYDRLTSSVWRNPAGLGRMGRLVPQRLQGDASIVGKGKTWRFGDLTQTAKILDDTCQVNIFPVGAMSDPLDDFYGAVGKAVLKVAVSGMVTNGDNNSLQITVDTLAVYLRDTYDFNGEQPLGLWSENGLNHGRIAEGWFYETGRATHIGIEAPEKPHRPDPAEEFGVGNADFRLYRDKFGRGYDYINLTDVKMSKLSQPQTFNLP